MSSRSVGGRTRDDSDDGAASPVVATATLVHDATKEVWTCAVSPDGKWWVTAGQGGIIKVWDAASRACVRTLPPDAAHGSSAVWRCAFSPDGSRLATASSDCTVAIWKVSSWEVERVLRGHGDWVRSCAWSSDGTRLVTGSSDKTVKVWRVADGSVVDTLKGHTNTVYDVCFSPDDTMVASASGDGTMKLWRVAPVGGGGGGGERGGGTAATATVAGEEEWRCVRTFRHPKQVISCAFSPTRDGTRMRLVSGCDDGRVRVWEVAGAGGAPGGSSSSIGSSIAITNGVLAIFPAKSVRM